MTITHFQPNSIAIPRHDSEEQLYAWMDSQCVGKFDRAKQAVNDWWSSVVISLIAADAFYGFDTSIGNSGTQRMCPRLLDWCKTHGLKSETQRSKARSAARVCLSHGYQPSELIDEIGFEKLAEVGRGETRDRTALIEAALDGATLKEIAELKKQEQNDPEFVKGQIDNYQATINQLLESRSSCRRGDGDYERFTSRVTNFKRQIKELESKLDKLASDQTLVNHDDSADEIHQLNQQLDAAKAEAEKAKAEADKLFKLKEKNEQLKQRVEELSDVQYVTPDLVDHRLEMINLQSSAWANLAYTFEKARELSTDPSEVTRAQKGILYSWEQWIHHLPMDLLIQLEEMFQKRMSEGTIDQEATNTLINVTLN